MPIVTVKNDCNIGNVGNGTATANPPGYWLYPYTYQWYVMTSVPMPTITQNAQTLISSFALSYQWIVNGTTILGATNQSYLVTSNGIYQVYVTYDNGCSSISIPINVTITDAEILENEETIILYPNPATDYFSIKGFREQGEEKANIEVYDIFGTLVIKEARLEAINITNLLTGGYIVHLTSKAGNYWFKLIKN
jgi:hypothetical protein